jgi:hypothetical protein
MWNWMKSLFMPAQIILPDPDMIIAQQIHETRLDMLRAEKELEYWSSQVPMLNQRLQRLRCEQAV